MMKGRATTSARRLAFLEAIAWLEYRIEVCREAEDRYSVANGHEPISSATERSARFELQLAVRKLAEMANLPRRSRKLRDAVAERERYVAERRALLAPHKDTTP